MTTNREFDIVAHGATGFTGRLVAEHTLKRHGVGGDVRWALSGRSLSKLEEVRVALGAPDLPLVIADASDPASLRALTERAAVVISTVGPYQIYGEPLIAACAETGADYVDLCGEPGWMAAMIRKYDAAAKASGARITFSCGFDSIPFDLGVVFLQAEAQRRFGQPLRRVRGRIMSMKGGFSGGTVLSGMTTQIAASRDPELRKTLADPFALTPGFSGPPQPPGDKAAYDETLDVWTHVFIMAGINTKNVHRTNFLLDHSFGADFLYDEMQVSGPGRDGEKRARSAQSASGVMSFALGNPVMRAIAKRVLPKPGQGPSLEQRETGHFHLVFIGDTADGRRLRASVRGDRDPGYAGTSRMISESALCLARDVGRDRAPGGVWTPGAAMGETLIARLRQHAGITFEIDG
jgi:short subunit dehydrogenase-like uncharacterized protein